jgi:phosphoglycolate phosphatase-like HAD superfamily hydrolase
VIGMGLMQALAHAAPDVPPEKYPELGARYRHHYVAHQNDISLFDGVLPMLADAEKARHHWLAVATGKSRRGLDAALHAWNCTAVRRLAHGRRDRRQAASAHAAGADARIRRGARAC